MIVSSHSPASVSTTLEPCRVAPYVNVPSIRLPSAYDRLQPFSGFSAFDPALFSAAQQVSPKLPFFSSQNKSPNQKNFVPSPRTKVLFSCLVIKRFFFSFFFLTVRSSSGCFFNKFFTISLVSAISVRPRSVSSRSSRPSLFKKLKYSRFEIQSEETCGSFTNVHGENLNSFVFNFFSAVIIKNFLFFQSNSRKNVQRF